MGRSLSPRGSSAPQTPRTPGHVAVACIRYMLALRTAAPRPLSMAACSLCRVSPTPHRPDGQGRMWCQRLTGFARYHAGTDLHALLCEFKRLLTPRNAAGRPGRFSGEFQAAWVQGCGGGVPVTLESTRIMGVNPWWNTAGHKATARTLGELHHRACPAFHHPHSMGDQKDRSGRGGGFSALWGARVHSHFQRRHCPRMSY